jgi:hypothetical protein
MTSVDTVYVTNTHISDFDYGIKIQGGGVNLHHGFFSNISCQSNLTSLTIKPASAGQKIYELFFSIASSRERMAQHRRRQESSFIRMAEPLIRSRTSVLLIA